MLFVSSDTLNRLLQAKDVSITHIHYKGVIYCSICMSSYGHNKIKYNLEGQACVGNICDSCVSDFKKLNAQQKQYYEEFASTLVKDYDSFLRDIEKEIKNEQT